MTSMDQTAFQHQIRFDTASTSKILKTICHPFMSGKLVMVNKNYVSYEKAERRIYTLPFLSCRLEAEVTEKGADRI